MRGMQEMQILFPGQEDILEKEMTTCSSILAWKIPWAEQAGGLQSIGLQKIRHNWATEHSTCPILAPRPEIEPAAPELEGKVLTIGLPGNSVSGVF